MLVYRSIAHRKLLGTFATVIFRSLLGLPTRDLIKEEEKTKWPSELPVSRGRVLKPEAPRSIHVGSDPFLRDVEHLHCGGRMTNASDEDLKSRNVAQDRSLQPHVRRD